jgi:DNA-binding beta-propeller fold protein YncE
LLGAALLAPCAAKTPSYAIIAVEEMLGRVTILAADDPTRRVSVAVGFKPHEVVVSADGRSAFVSNFGLNDAENRDGIAGETVTAIDIATATIRAAFRLPDQLKAPHGLGIRPGQISDLYTNAEQGDQMVVFDTGDGRVKRSFALPAGIHNFIFSKSGSELFAFAPQGSVYRLDADTGKILASRDLGGPVRGLAWTSDAKHILASIRGAIAVLNPASLASEHEMSLHSETQPFYSAATADGRLILVPAVFAGEVIVLDARTGNVIRHLAAQTPLRVMLSPDAGSAYVANVSPRGDEISIINLKTFEVSQISGLRDVNGLAVSSVLPTPLRH